MPVANHTGSLPEKTKQLCVVPSKPLCCLTVLIQWSKVQILQMFVVPWSQAESLLAGHTQPLVLVGCTQRLALLARTRQLVPAGCTQLQALLARTQPLEPP